jgi:hypothetical protein
MLLIPSLLLKIIGWLLELGGKGTNLVEFGTMKGAVSPVIVLLSRVNVTVCGSATDDGLYQVTLWPAEISSFWGKN